MEAQQRDGAGDQPSLAVTKGASVAGAEGGGSRDRVSVLKALISELGVPPFTAYEKVLPKLMFDKRFTSIPKEDRETTFLIARRQLIGSARAQQQRKQREAVDSCRAFFADLLRRGHVHTTSTLDSLETK